MIDLTLTPDQEAQAQRLFEREVQARVVGYFEGQVHRRDYPPYGAKGRQIGSGPVERACKAVVGLWRKGGGMRWGENGADAVAHLRARFRSEKGQWEGFWTQN